MASTPLTYVVWACISGRWQFVADTTSRRVAQSHVDDARIHGAVATRILVNS